MSQATHSLLARLEGLDAPELRRLLVEHGDDLAVGDAWLLHRS